MKKIYLFIILISGAVTVMSQIPESKWVGDTIGPFNIITFEEPTEFIHINNSAQNIWQIGTPQKTLFNQAYSVPRAIVTDTTGFYPDNNNSSFDLYIGQFNTFYFYPMEFFIDFRHRFDTDTLHDGGFISVSWDHGQTFSNIRTDSLSKHTWWCTPSTFNCYYGNTNLYDTTAFLANGEPGFSGNSGGWIHSSISWYDLPVEHMAEFPPDTTIIRFNFYSDNLHNDKEGWMIDQIRIFAIDLGGGIKEGSGSAKKAKVLPNPIQNSAAVVLDKVYDHVEYMLMDPSGRNVAIGNPGKCRIFRIERADCLTGVYFLKILMEGEIPEVHRVIFQ